MSRRWDARVAATHHDLVLLGRVHGDRDGDEGDAQEHVDDGPPGEVGEALVDGRDDGGDEGGEPGQLRQVSQRRRRGQAAQGRLTMLMEMVARAKGSPMMLVSEKDGLPL